MHRDIRIPIDVTVDALHDTEVRLVKCLEDNRNLTSQMKEITARNEALGMMISYDVVSITYSCIRVCVTQAKRSIKRTCERIEHQE